MENLKKNPLSLQLNVEDFAPASNDEKKSLVVELAILCCAYYNSQCSPVTDRQRV